MNNMNNMQITISYRVKNICKFLYFSRNIEISFHSALKSAYNVDKYRITVG